MNKCTCRPTKNNEALCDYCSSKYEEFLKDIPCVTEIHRDIDYCGRCESLLCGSTKCLYCTRRV